MIMIRRDEPAQGEGPAAFAPGQLVRHRRYGYRGVVVALDLRCEAPDSWYQSNQSQPRKSQPWYHVLVDGSPQTTYAAEENLMADTSDGPIAHPLVEAFFDAFENGTYRRNSRPWP